jgi:hypothetical protein
LRRLKTAGTDAVIGGQKHLESTRLRGSQ